jgi:hypothetical protein
MIICSSRCAGQFQVVEADLPQSDGNLDSEGCDIQRGGEDDRKRGSNVHSAGHNNGDSKEDKGGIIDEEIISPAAGSSRKRRDSDGTQFFRRINLIFLRGDIGCVGYCFKSRVCHLAQLKRHTVKYRVSEIHHICLSSD